MIKKFIIFIITIFTIDSVCNETIAKSKSKNSSKRSASSSKKTSKKKSSSKRSASSSKNTSEKKSSSKRSASSKKVRASAKKTNSRVVTSKVNDKETETETETKTKTETKDTETKTKEIETKDAEIEKLKTELEETKQELENSKEEVDSCKSESQRSGHKHLYGNTIISQDEAGSFSKDLDAGCYEIIITGAGGAASRVRKGIGYNSTYNQTITTLKLVQKGASGGKYTIDACLKSSCKIYGNLGVAGGCKKEGENGNNGGDSWFTFDCSNENIKSGGYTGILYACEGGIGGLKDAKTEENPSSASCYMQAKTDSETRLYMHNAGYTTVGGGSDGGNNSDSEDCGGKNGTILIREIK